MFTVEVGANIPLTLQVYDGNTNLEVTAVITQKDGKEFMRVKIDHVASGFYANFKTKMPDIELLFAQYFTNSDQYEIVNEVFKAAPKVQIEERPILGEVVSSGKSDISLIIGVLDDSQKDENIDRI